MITFDDIEVRYGDTVALPHFNLHIERGEFFTLLGPSGSGKTTALRTLAGLNTPSRGRITVNGKDVTNLAPHRRGVAMVFQNYALFPTMDVADNIAFGLTVKRVGRAEKDRKVQDAADKVGLTQEQLTRRLDELSGGQQQRVAIARALVLEPEILLLDEPLSNLDAKLRHQMRLQLKALQSDVGITAVYVTHDQDEALAMSDRIAVFQSGRLEQVGTPQEIYSAPATEFVCRFVGESTKLGPQLVEALAPGTGDQVTYLRSERPTVHLAEGPAAGSPAADGAAAVPGTVVQRQFHGTHSVIMVRCLDTDLLVQAPETGRRLPDAGEAVHVRIDPAALLRFGPEQAAPTAEAAL